MDYEKKYKDALELAKDYFKANQKLGELEENDVLSDIFPELKESEDERIRKALVRFHKSTIDIDGIKGADILAWLEKQGESYTKKDVDDAYLKGISDAKHELEKQGTPAKLSEEEQNSFAKGVLSRCALSFIDYLDAHSYEGKMCVSNGECEDIENAFHNAMWDKLHRYYCKYIEKQGEQKPFDYEHATITQKDFAPINDTDEEIVESVKSASVLDMVETSPIEPSQKEDEKIRKELIDAIQGLWVNDALPMPLSVKRKDGWLAWLEKQGEQKPTIDVDAMVEKYRNGYSLVEAFGKDLIEVKCNGYRQGILDTIEKMKGE